jgi:hypothetical protein
MRSKQKSCKAEKSIASVIRKLYFLGLLAQGIPASSTSTKSQKSFTLRRVASTPRNQEENRPHFGDTYGANFWTHRLISMVQSVAYGKVPHSEEFSSYSHRIMESYNDDDGSLNGEGSDNSINPRSPMNNATKSLWPECLSLSCGTCQELIEFEEPSLSIIEIVSADTVILQEFRTDRVLIVCNNEKVIMTPRIR